MASNLVTSLASFFQLGVLFTTMISNSWLADYHLWNYFVVCSIVCLKVATFKCCCKLNYLTRFKRWIPWLFNSKTSIGITIIGIIKRDAWFGFRNSKEHIHRKESAPIDKKKHQPFQNTLMNDERWWRFQSILLVVTSICKTCMLMLYVSTHNNRIDWSNFPKILEYFIWKV